MFKKMALRYAEKRVPKVSMDEIRKDVDARHEAAAGAVAVRYTRGNTSVQRDAYLMEEDLPRRLNRRGKPNE